MKKMKAISKSFSRKLILLITCLTLVLTSGMLMSFNGSLTAFGANTIAADIPSMTDSDGKFYADYTTHDEAVAAGLALSEDIADEGFILLKNDGTLPMTNVKRVSVFGKNSVNIVRGGSGSSGSSSVGRKEVSDSLEAANFMVNPKLKAFYSDNTLSGAVRSMSGGDTNWPQARIGETPTDKYSREIKESFKAYDEAAIVVLSRAGGENFDLPRQGILDNVDKSKHYLELSDNELDLIDMVKENFETITVVINSAHAMELGELQDDPQINSIVWVGVPGASGIMALGRILRGTVNPSGRTIDIYARDFSKDPTWQNFSFNDQTDAAYLAAAESAKDTNDKRNALISGFHLLDKDGNRFNNYVSPGPAGAGLKAVFYEEGIYIGYRYYETVAADLQAKSGDGEDWYGDSVVYPFGYGLSYTEFSQEIVGWNVDGSNNAVLCEDSGTITIQVEVTNQGIYAGKEVVQLYYTTEYSEGEIEKAHVVMGAFAKTKMLKPGQSQILTLTIDVQDMASYDYSDANDNGFCGYELDAGSVGIKIMKNSHEAFDSIDFTVGAGGIQYDKDKVTGNDVKNRFTGESIVDNGVTSDSKFNDITQNRFNSLPLATDFDMTIMTRADYTESFPKSPTKTDLTMGENSTFYSTVSRQFSISEYSDKDPWYKTAVDAKGPTQQGNTVVNDKAFTQAPETAAANRSVTYKFTDMMGAKHDDPRWNTILNDLKWSEMITMVAWGGYNTHLPTVLGLPEVVREEDGPGALNGSNFFPCGEPVLAATFNIKLAEAVGIIAGNTALLKSTLATGWYAPAMNIHRSPFSGRNAEYYSEDGFISGKMGAATVRGAQSKGLATYIKHFALNDQETHRYELVTYADEQTIREVYLKTFKITVQEGGPSGLMNAFNRIGRIPSEANYMLLTEILRNEWGFEGKVITDYYVIQASAYEKVWQNPNALWAAGCDAPLIGMFNGPSVSDNSGTSSDGIEGVWDDAQQCVVFKGVKNYTQWIAVRNAAHNVLFTAANTNLMKNGYVSNPMSGNTTANENKGAVLVRGVAGKTFSVATSADLTGHAATYRLASGNLPAGMTLATATGIISGTPTTPGIYNFTAGIAIDGWVGLQSGSAYSSAYTANYRVTVEEPISATTSLTSGQLGIAINSTLSANVNISLNDSIPVTFTLQNSTLPKGLTLNNGAISGMPTETGTYSFTIRMTYRLIGATSSTNVDTTYTMIVTDPNAPTIDSVTDELNDLKEDIDGLTKDINELTKENGNLTKEIKDLKDQIKTLTSDEGGCNSIIEGSSIIMFAVLIVAGLCVMLFTRKFKKENKK